jgi:ribonuclease P protein component
MLPHSRRASRILFEKTLKNSKVSHSEYFSLRIGINDSPLSRYAFIVSKKVATKATKRNQIRRRGYASLEHIIDTILPGYVLLFFAKKGIETLSQYSLEQAITSYLSQHNLIQ